MDAFIYIPAHSLGSISLGMGTGKENGETTVEAQILRIWPDLYAVDKRRAIPRERHSKWLVEWEWGAASNIQDMPESRRNVPLVSPLTVLSPSKRAARSRRRQDRGGSLPPPTPSVHTTGTEFERSGAPSSATAKVQAGYATCVPRAKRLDAVTTRHHS